LEVGFNLNY